MALNNFHKPFVYIYDKGHCEYEIGTKGDKYLLSFQDLNKFFVRYVTDTLKQSLAVDLLSSYYIKKID